MMNYHDKIKEMLIEEINRSEEIKSLLQEQKQLEEALNDKETAKLALFALLLKEREKTNALLESINANLEKLAKLLEKANNNETVNESLSNIGLNNININAAGEITMLSEQDMKILKIVQEKGQVTAEIIKKEMNYKGLNAASQRLNKLFREGYLKKIRAGKKTYFVLVKKPLAPMP